EMWWIQYYLPHKSDPVRESLGTKNRRVAESHLKKIEYQLDTGQLQATTNTPLDAFLEEYLEHMESEHPRTTYRNTLSTLRCTFGERCPALELKPRGRRKTPSVPPLEVDRLEDITPPLIAEFLRLRRQKDGISPKTSNNYRAELHAMVEWAIEHKGFRPPQAGYRNPISEVKRCRESASDITYLSKEDISGQLEVLEGEPQMQMMVAALIYGGFRRAEIMWLTTDDVDLRENVVRVRAKTIEGTSWQPKTRTNRVVPISRTLHSYLDGYRRQVGDCPWQFPSPEGCRWDGDNWSYHLRKINQRHDLPWSALDYRHTFGSQLAMKGESLYKISTLMGNSPQICRRHYAHLTPESLQDAVEFENCSQSRGVSGREQSEEKKIIDLSSRRVLV
ncbi:MAG: tyrosine-type recombinase/integrase, partial [Planctomycetota bacterium]